MSKPEATLRTMMSLWLEQTDALAERLTLDSGSPQIGAPLLALRQAQSAVAILFAQRAQGTPEKYAKLASALSLAQRD